jgi:hypothetical protein
MSIGNTIVSLGAGQKRFVNISIHNADGWIRQYYVNVDGLKVDSSGVRSSAGALKPIPPGMVFNVEHPDVVTENFEDYSNSLSLTVNTQTPSGDFVLPWEICYRNLDLSQNQSTYFPYEKDAKCINEPAFKIHVN